MNTIYLQNLGTVSYAQGLEAQAEATRAVSANESGAGRVLVCEHSPVITCGRSGGSEDILLSGDRLAALGIEVHESVRGGKVTCHNPGQAVVYPILHLGLLGIDAHTYLRTLEQAVMTALAGFGLEADRKPGLTGVWVGDSKICAVGISLRRRVSGHGLALNVCNDLDIFKAVVPCGITEYGVTSLQREGVRLAVQDAGMRVLAALGDLLGVSVAAFEPVPAAGRYTDEHSDFLQGNMIPVRCAYQEKEATR